MDRSYIEVPGYQLHELPPLLVHGIPEDASRSEVMVRAAAIVETEDMIAESAPEVMEHRKLDLAVHLTDQYFGLLTHWQWGDSVIEWIRQCEITFGTRIELRNLLRNDVWPHAGRCSFVQLLEDKAIETAGVELEKAVGLRLTFRQMPPIRCCSDQFLLYLSRTVANTTYQKWQSMTPAPVAALPPERFTFEVLNLSI